MAEITRAVRLTVYARADYCCERCGTYAEGGSVHHRSGRRMGGSRDPRKGLPSNLVLLCGSGTTGCHGEIGSMAQEHYADGWLVIYGDDPADIPVNHKVHGVVWLTDDGGFSNERPAA